MESEDPSPEAEESSPPSDNSTRRQLFTVIAAVVGLAVFAIWANRGSESPNVEVAPSTSTSITDVSVAGPLIPPIDGCTLLTEAEVEEATGVLELEWVRRGVLMLARREGCVWQQMVDNQQVEGLSVQIAPGHPDDFEPGAEFDGTAGVDVAEVGDLAVWFGDDDGGVLSVVQGTPQGFLFIRLGLNRPGLDNPARLEIVKGLAVTAIERIQFGPVPPVETDLCQLVTDAEAESVLGPHRAGRPGSRDEVTIIDNFSGLVTLSQPGDFSCKKLILAEIYVAIESGSATDFEGGADVEGVAGVPVTGIGDEGVWFEEVPVRSSFAAPHHAGILTIRQGEARLRIVLALPDVEPADQLGIARQFAVGALTRLRGDGSLVTRIAHEPPDLSGVSFVDNLLVKEDAGEWTRGEGLVATLQYFVGELDASQVLRHPDLADFSGTGIIRLAREYLESGPDAAARAEIERLLDPLTFDGDRSEPSVGANPATAMLTAQLVSFGPVAQEEEDQPESCSSSDPTTPGFSPVPVYDDIDIGPWQFVAYFPLPGSEGGWNPDTHLLWALEAMEKSLEKYDTGGLPCIHLVFSNQGGPYTYVLDTLQPGICGVVLNRPMQTRNESHFKQQIAADMAHCVIPVYYPDQFEVASYLNHRWWNHALAEYMSNVVYESVDCGGNRCDLEWRLSPALATQELGVPMVYRSAANWLFFQQVFWEAGNEGVAALVDALPASSEPLDHEKALAEVAGMDQFYHDFAKALTDASIGDTGGGNVPYQPQAWTIPIAGRQVVLDEPEPFGMTRLHLVIDDGKYACIEHVKAGDVVASFRPGKPGGGGAVGGWEQLPEEEEVFSGELVVAVTTTKEGGEFTLNVSDVKDDPECEDDEPPPPDSAADPCLLELCGPTDYYRFWEQLSEWLRSLLPQPSN